jgi:hypothetical protein
MDSVEDLINVLKKGHNSALQLDTLMQGDNALLVQEIVSSLSKAINSLENTPLVNDKRSKVHAAKQSGDKRRYLILLFIFPVHYLICMFYLIYF